jgi:hypothetical protein
MTERLRAALAMVFWRVPCPAERGTICVGELKGHKDEEVVLYVNCDTSCPVPRSTRRTEMFYRFLTKRRHLSVQRVAPRNRRSEFPIESRVW